jgi:hypothetical protein
MKLFRILAVTSAAVTLLVCHPHGAEHPDIPPPGAFERTLQHDLDTYFGAAESVPIRVTYELLREQPTITGIAYPKYYLWVTVRSEQRVVRVGAARVAAINKKFEVTNFIAAQYLIDHPGYAASIFPAPLVSDIESRARGARPTAQRGA